MGSELNQIRKCFQPWQFYVDYWINSGAEDTEFMMWVYQELAPDNFQVGYFIPTGDRTWMPDGSYKTREEAAARVNYLNGGKR